MMITKYVASWQGKNEDGTPATIHVECATFKEIELLPSVGWLSIEKKAATWECDGRDNCMVDA